MPRPTPVTDAERTELRRLYLAATQGRWKATSVAEVAQHRLMAETGTGGEWYLGTLNHAADVELAAAARNALPRLFAEIDELRRRAGARKRVLVMGTVGCELAVADAHLP